MIECDRCTDKACSKDRDCFTIQDRSMAEYQGEALILARTSSGVEAAYYMEKNRLEELIVFCRDMKYRKLGLAFCIGLSQEAALLGEFLRSEFEVHAVCCKAGGIDKQALNLDSIIPDSRETMCNPIGQAILLNETGTDLNIICGLCIGHDIQFTRHSIAPVTTFIVKDRMLGHNPAAALYCRYIRKRLRPEP